MAYHFSANQFEKAYNSKRLGNWELPKWYPPRPRQRHGATKIISNDAGHVLPPSKRIDKNPWGNYRSTYQLPDKITRRFSNDYNDCLNRRETWRNFPSAPQYCRDNRTNPKVNYLATAALDAECKTKCESLPVAEKPKKSFDLEYVPGDYTPPGQQHPSREVLLQDKYERDNGIEPELPLDKLYLGDHSCMEQNCKDYNETFSAPIPLTAALTKSLVSPPVPEQPLDEPKMPMSIAAQRSITGKPHERCPSPIVPAYANFEQAKRMHHDNLDHQPLPDCVADAAYRKLQMTGGHGGLALDIDPIATGVGVKTYNAGPTHCTKMKVYRPKTCGVVPKVYKTDAYRPVSSAQPAKKMGAMDLAIGWDYRPQNPYDEPQRPQHIDGSNDSAGPAVFTCVKTPREDSAAGADAGRSAGVFNSTMGELGFFDKDIMRRKTDFTGRKIDFNENYACDLPPARAQSVSRRFVDEVSNMPNRYDKQYQSSPNIMSDRDLKNLRDKYLGPSDDLCVGGMQPACKRSSPGFLQRARSRLCHKVAPEPACCHHVVPTFDRANHCKAFRAGIPRHNATGQFISADTGCGMPSHHNSRVLVVPRPRNPYTKKNYDIDTLVPPFTSIAGGAKNGGYPEHWRLASVYQHAYKPIQQRRQPLLHTVYK